jgi:hypothetical protein
MEAVAVAGPVAEAARAERARRIWRVFAVGVLVLFAGYLVRTIADDAHNWSQSLAVGGIFGGSGLALGWLARGAYTKIPVAMPRWIFTIVLGWHALFGPVMLATRIVTRVTSNDQPGIVLWPHVVHWINSFE